MYAAPINWQTILKLGNCENNVAKPAVAPIIATLRPNKIPTKNGIPFLTPNVAPVAAKAKGAGPGEPNKRAVVVIKTINDSSKLLIPI